MTTSQKVRTRLDHNTDHFSDIMKTRSHEMSFTDLRRHSHIAPKNTGF